MHAGASSLQVTTYVLQFCDMTLQIVEPEISEAVASSQFYTCNVWISLEWATSNNMSIEYALIVAGIGS